MKDEHKSLSQPEKRVRFRISRRLSIILICFFIATVFWLLIALSRDYPATVSFPIVYTNLPNRKVIVNDLPDSIALQIKAKGFRILSYSLQQKRKALAIDVASRLMSGRQLEGEVLALPTRVFASDFARQFGPDISIYGYQPDSIVFYFSDRITKRLPVHLNLSVQFDRQYDYSGPISLQPDSVDVSGPPSVVNTMNGIETDEIRLSGIKSDIMTNASVKAGKYLTYNHNTIKVKAPVEKFTEGSTRVMIKAMNIPNGYTLKTFPDRVDVKYLVALSRYNEVKEYMFDVIVDASQLSSNHPEKIKVQLIRFPDFTRDLSAEPEKVDYILRKQ